eukprot:GHVR01117070.1.p1 GENE.GHVR01117070.1~~GHVR01117070.1.p1  ORF type:complete len:603 (+),score=203.06 GHVR01117070.1:132-1940(+)
MDLHTDTHTHTHMNKNLLKCIVHHHIHTHTHTHTQTHTHTHTQMSDVDTDMYKNDINLVDTHTHTHTHTDTHTPENVDSIDNDSILYNKNSIKQQQPQQEEEQINKDNSSQQQQQNSQILSVDINPIQQHINPTQQLHINPVVEFNTPIEEVQLYPKKDHAKEEGKEDHVGKANVGNPMKANVGNPMKANVGNHVKAKENPKGKKPVESPVKGKKPAEGKKAVAEGKKPVAEGKKPVAEGKKAVESPVKGKKAVEGETKKDKPKEKTDTEKNTHTVPDESKLESNNIHIGGLETRFGELKWTENIQMDDVWSQNIMVGNIYRPSICGQEIIESYSNYWTFVIELEQPCLMIPRMMFTHMMKYIPTLQCPEGISPPDTDLSMTTRKFEETEDEDTKLPKEYFDSNDGRVYKYQDKPDLCTIKKKDFKGLPSFSFYMRQEDDTTINIPLDSLLINDKEDSYTLCVGYMDSFETGSERLIWGITTNPFISIGSMVFNSLYVAADLTNKSIGFAPKTNVKHDDYSMCPPKPVCIGSETYVGDTNSCRPPYCHHYFMKVYDRSTGECILPIGFGASLIFLAFLFGFCELGLLLWRNRLTRAVKIKCS